MKKKLAILAVLSVIAVIFSGYQGVVLYGTEYVQTRPRYSFGVLAANGWWDCNWSYCKKITIDADKVDTDQTNFPVLLYRSADPELAANARSNGDDIAFVDCYNSTQYQHEIEKFDSNTGELVVWVNVSSVSSTTDTILYMYYGNPDCGNQQDVTGTWNPNYVMVQHLNETSGATVYDSTSNDNDGTINTATANSSSKIDGGYDFDGNDNITVSDASSLDISSAITLEGWVKDPPWTSDDDTSVKIIDKRKEERTIDNNGVLTVEREIYSGKKTELIFAVLYSEGINLEEIALNDNSVYGGFYKQEMYTSDAEEKIENIRLKLPEELKELTFIGYSNPFIIDDVETIKISFAKDVDKSITNGRISYLLMSSDGSYDYETTTYWDNSDIYTDWGNPFSVYRFLIDYLNYNLSDCNVLTPEDALDKTVNEEDFLIIDIRSEEDFIDNHIDGSISIPDLYMDCTECLKSQIESYKDKKIILYGADSLNLRMVYELFLKMNFKEVYTLNNEIESCKDAGFQIITKRDISSFESEINNSLADGKPVLIYFGLDGCSACEEEKNEIEKVKNSLKNKITFFELNRNIDVEIFSQYNVGTYPMIFFIHDKNEKGYIFNQFMGITESVTIINLYNRYKNNEFSENSIELWYGDLGSRAVRISTPISEKLENDEEVPVMLKFNDEIDIDEKLELFENKGFKNTGVVYSNGIISGKINKEIYNELKNDNDISRIYLDEFFSPLLDESLPLINYDIAFENYGFTGAGKKICIIDSGVNSDLVSYSYGYDFVNNDEIPEDEINHGTKVASIIKSIAPDSELIVAKVIGGDGVGYESDVLEALEWCIAQNPDVISFSIGSTNTCSGFCNANLVAKMANNATEQGIFVVAATGNDGGKNLSSPACGSNVFSVSSTDNFDEIASFSNVNPTVDMFAPGVGINTPAGVGSGTSFSAPFVAGAALLLLEKENLIPEDLKYRLKSTGKPIYYKYNDTLELDIARLDVFNALENNVTMVPYNYSRWWYSVLLYDGTYASFGECEDWCINEGGECTSGYCDPSDKYPSCIEEGGCAANDPCLAMEAFDCEPAREYCLCTAGGGGNQEPTAAYLSGEDAVQYAQYEYSFTTRHDDQDGSGEIEYAYGAVGDSYNDIQFRCDPNSGASPTVTVVEGNTYLWPLAGNPTASRSAYGATGWDITWTYTIDWDWDHDDSAVVDYWACTTDDNGGNSSWSQYNANDNYENDLVIKTVTYELNNSEYSEDGDTTLTEGEWFRGGAGVRATGVVCFEGASTTYPAGTNGGDVQLWADGTDLDENYDADNLGSGTGTYTTPYYNTSNISGTIDADYDFNVSITEVATGGSYGSPDFVTTLVNSSRDNQNPTSSVDAISPYSHSTNPLAITATANDGSGAGLKNVTLYYRCSSDNITWDTPDPLEIIYAEQNTEQYVGKTAQTLATLSYTEFTANEDYILFASSHVKSDTDNMAAEIKMQHGATVFTETYEMQNAPDDNDTQWVYSTFIKYTAPGGESEDDITLKGRAVTGGAGTASFDEISLMAIPLANLTENYDYWYDGNTTVETSMDDSWSTTGANITFTPDGSSDYVIFGTSRCDVQSVVDDDMLSMRLYDGSSELTRVERDNEHTSDQPVISLMYVLEAPAASSKTYSLQFCGDGVDDKESSQLLILKLSAFEDSVYNQTSSDTAILAESWDELGSATDLTPTFDDNAIVFWSNAYQHDGDGDPPPDPWTAAIKYRAISAKQGGASSVVKQTAAYQICSWNSVSGSEGSDQGFAIMFDNISTLSTSSYDFTLEASEESDGGAEHIDRAVCIVAFTHRTAQDNWTKWNDASNPDTDPWVAASWNFDFPDGSGYYEFYTIAEDNTSNVEDTPINADASCQYTGGEAAPSVTDVTVHSENDFTLDDLIGTGTISNGELANSTFEWWESTSEGGTYTAKGENSTTLDSDLTNETYWYKFEYTPGHGVDGSGISYGTAVNSSAFRVNELNESADGYSGTYHENGSLTFADWGTLQITGSLTVEGHVYMPPAGGAGGSATYLDLGTGNHKFGSFEMDGGTVNLTSGTLNITSENATTGYALDIDSVINTNNNGTIEISTNTNTNIDITPGLTKIYNLTINTQGDQYNVLWDNPAIINNSLVITSGTFAPASAAYPIDAGNVTINGGTLGTAVGTTGVWTFDSLNLSSGTVYATSDKIYIEGENSNGFAIDLDGTFTNASGTIQINTSTAAEVDLVATSGGVYDLILDTPSGGFDWNGNTNIGNNLTLTKGLFQPNSAGDTLGVLGNVTITQGVLGGNGASGEWSMASLTQSEGGTIEATTGSIVITDEAGSGYAIDLDGNFNANSGTIEINSGADTLIDIAGTGNLYKLIVDNNGYTTTSNAAATVDNNVTIQAGKFNITASLKITDLDINSGADFDITDGAILNLSGGNLYQNGKSNITAGSVEYINISGTVFNLTSAENVSLYLIPSNPSDPVGYSNIGKYVNVTNRTGNATVDINITYDDSDLGGVTESTLVMQEYNWSTATWTEIDDTGVNTDENYVWGNSITTFSNFGPLGGAESPPSVTDVTIHSPHDFTLDDLIGTGTISSGELENSTFEWWESATEGGTYRAKGINSTTLDSDLTNETFWYKFEYTPGHGEDGSGVSYGTKVNSSEFQVTPLNESAGTFSGTYDEEENLTIGNSGSLTISGTLDLEGNVTIEHGGGIDFGDNNIEIGSLSVDSTSSCTGTSKTIFITSENTSSTYAVDIDGTFTNSSGTIQINTTAATEVDLLSTIDVYDFIVNSGSTVDWNGNTYIGDDLIVTGGTFQPGSNEYILNVTDNVTVNGGTLGGNSANARWEFKSFYMSSGTLDATSGSLNILGEDGEGYAMDIQGGTIDNSSGYLRVFFNDSDTNLRISPTTGSFINIVTYSSGPYAAILQSGLEVGFSLYLLSGELDTNNNAVKVTSGSQSPYMIVSSSAYLDGADDTVDHNFGAIDLDGTFNGSSSSKIIITDNSLSGGYAIDIDGTYNANSNTIEINSNGDAKLDITGTGNLYNLIIDTDGYNVTNAVSTTVDNNVTVEGGEFNITADLTTGDLDINSGADFEIRSSSTLTLTGNLYQNGKFNITAGEARDIDISGTVFNLTSAENISLYTTPSNPSNPTGYNNIGKYVNVTNLTGNATVDINMTYDDGDLGSVTESTLILQEYNWSTATWTEITDTGVNTTENYVWGNGITAFSIFGPFGTSPNKGIISKGQASYSLEMNNGGTTLYGYIDSTATNISIDSEWHYVVLTYDGSTIRLYKDGELVDSKAGTGITTNNNDLKLGDFMTGTLDELRISNTAKTTGYINTTYNNTNSPTAFATFSDQIGVLSTWAYRKKVWINASLVDNDLPYFPVLISMTDSDLKNYAHSLGNDIIFLNSTFDWLNSSYTDRRPHEVEFYDNSDGELVAWVNVSCVSSVSNTSIYMYYGTSSCWCNRENPNGVWDTNYIMVQHLNETSDPHQDSTIYNNDGNESGGVNQSATDEIIDGADWFDGSNDIIDFENSSIFDMGEKDFTIEAWIKSTDSDGFIVAKFSSTLLGSEGYALELYSNKLRGLLNTGTSEEGNAIIGPSNATINNDNWHYLAASFDRDSWGSLYIDGEVDNQTDISGVGDIDNELHLNIANDSSPGGNPFKGTIDEVRISNIIRNSSWINTTFENINDTSAFIEFGSHEIQNVGPTQSSPSPEDGATGESLNPTLQITVGDANQDAMNVSFWTNATGTWGLIGYNASVYNGTYQQTNSSMNSYETKYWWSVNVTDNTTWTNVTYNFTTIAETNATETIRPEGNGQSSQLTPYPLDLPHWQYVDETTQNGDTDYVLTHCQSLIYLNDTYALRDVEGLTGDIHNITIYLTGEDAAAGIPCGGMTANEMKPVIYTNSQYYDIDTAVTLTGSYVRYSWDYDVNPVTSANWTWEEINALEVGVALKGEDPQESRCTQVYVEINYTVASPFLYAFKDQKFTRISDFIPNAISADKEYMQSIDITDKIEVIDGKIKLRITEELDETTYLDRIYLRVNGNQIIEIKNIYYERKTLQPDPLKLLTSSIEKQLLKQSDNKYLLMKEGDKYILDFVAPNNYDKIEFVAEGYYIEHYK